MSSSTPRTPEEYRAWWEANSPVSFGFCWCGCGIATSLAATTFGSKGWVRGEPKRYLPGHHLSRARKSARLGGRRFSSAQEAEICRRYEAEESTTSLARELGVSTDLICQVLERGGIVWRGNRLYEYDDHFFDAIDTQAKAYWLGFIAADGNVDRKNRRLVIRLAAKDCEHLERLNVCLGSNKPIAIGAVRAFGKEYESANLDFASKILVAGLQAHGITPNKSLTHEWPRFLPDPLVAHYLRGYFDGDGSFHIDAKRPWNIAASLLGTRPFLEECRAVLVAHCELSEPTVRPKAKNNKAHVLRYGSRPQVQRFARFLYQDATIFLPRKHAKIVHLL